MLTLIPTPSRRTSAPCRRRSHDHTEKAEAASTCDDTLEALLRLLGHKDEATQGHTRRVTQMTLRLARAMRIPEEERAQIRRGALLHDIGKIGIPDRILQKAGPLTEAEWAVMKQHPMYARDLLWSIPALRPALPIPYSHHEKWDGTGYPQGLKGEEIPLAARIFAVVDVCDALLSDRVYRRGWPKQKVRAHIAALSGTHFDPAVVEVFLTIF